MKTQRNISDLRTIIPDSFLILRQNLVIYLFPILYAIIAAIVLFVIGIIGFMVIYVATIAMILESGEIREFVSIIVSGAVSIIVFGFVLMLIFFSGYVGGLGHLLKILLKSGKLSYSDFNKGVFRIGPRLFLGGVIMAILLILPFYWGITRLLNLYGIYDFATMQNGWNYMLRESIGSAHAGIVALTYLMDFIAILLLGFWWIITISERRFFIVSYIKSIIFFFRNPGAAFLLIVGNWFLIYFAMILFGLIWQLLAWQWLWGSLFGLYLVLPLTILTMLQFYDPNLRKVIQKKEDPLKMINLSEVKQ